MVVLRGTRDGLKVQLGDGDWLAVLADLEMQITRPQAKSFFRGALVTIDSGARILNTAQIETLSDLLSRNEMMLVMLTGSASETRTLAARLNLQPAHEPSLPEEPAPAPERAATEAAPVVPPFLGRAAAADPETLEQIVRANDPDHIELPRLTGAAADTALDTQDALMLRRTLRSGQIIRYEGHVIVFGDVNPGSEIVAGGDVIVWGKLRGVVHAGAQGNEQAVVGALYLAPTQLRIGSHIARAPDEKKRRTPTAEIARVRHDRIVVESWSAR